jgi:hypothetical protein
MRVLIVAIALSLAGCASNQVVTKTELQVFMPNQSLFQCQSVKRFPNADTLTDVDVAKLIVDLHSKNVECRKNMDAIHRTLETAKKEAEGK